ncbi:hypothetical protein BDL97_10G104100 [Sphagnum fallax]|nr:hypothetical protein BDL97_10G104100 [Sphagnum fallax]
MPDCPPSEQLDLRHRHSAGDGNSKGILGMQTQEQVPIPGQVASETVDLKMDMPLQPVKDDMIQLPDLLPDAVDFLPPLDEDLEPAPQDLNPANRTAECVGGKIHVLGIDMIDGDEWAMPQDLKLTGVHSSNVDPEENPLENGEMEQ